MRIVPPTTIRLIQVVLSAAILWTHISMAAEVRLVGDSANGIAAPEIQEFIKEAKIPLLSERETALPPATRAKIAEILKKIILPKDGKGPFYLIFADDLSINAHFLAPQGTEARAVIVNLGLIDFLRSDDELVAVLGHELEHGTSELQEHLNGLAKQTRTSKPSTVNSLFLNSLQKSVESEVDIKSVVNRVQPNGYNVEASARVLDRLTETYGDPLNSTHNMNQSRRNHLDMATTLMSRKGGIELNRQSNRNEIIDGSVNRALRDQAFVERRKSRVIQEFREPVTDLEGLIIRFKEGKASYAVEFEQAFGEAVSKRMKTVSEQLGGLISPAEELQLELRANAQVNELLQASQRRILGPGYRPKNYLEEEFISALSAPQPFTRLNGSEGAIKIISIQEKISKHELELSKLNRDSAHRSESRVRELQAELKRAHAQYDVLVTAYPGDAAKSILDSTWRLARESARLDDLGDLKGNNRIRRQLNSAGNSLKTLTTHIGGIEERRAERGASQAQRALPHLQSILKGEEPIYTIADSVAAMPPEQKSKFAPGFVNQLIGDFQTAFSQERSSARQARILARLSEFLSQLSIRDTGILDKTSAPDSIAGYFHKIVDTVAAHSRGFDALDSLGLNNPDLNPSRTLFQGGTSGFGWSKPLASQVFTPDRLSDIVRASENLALRNLDRSAKAGTLSRDGLEIINRHFGILYGQMLLTGKRTSFNEIQQSIERFSRFHGMIGPAADSRLTQAEVRQLFKDLLAARALAFADASVSKDEANAIARRLLDRPLRARAESRFLEVEDIKRLTDLAGRSENAAFDFAIGSPQWIRRTGGWPLSGQVEATRRIQLREEFLRHVNAKQPEKSRVAYEVMSGFNPGGASIDYPLLRRTKENAIHSAVLKRYSSLRRELPKDPTPQQYLRLFRKLFQEMGTEPGTFDSIKDSPKYESNMLQRVSWIKALHEARIEASSIQGRTHRGRVPARIIKERDSSVEDLLKRAHLFNPYEPMLAELPVQDQLELFKLHILGSGRSANNDQLFESIWENSKKTEAGKKLLLDPELMDLLYFNDTKKRFAEWTLEARFGVSELAASLRNKKTATPQVQQLRPLVPEIRAWMDRLLPEKSLIKDEILESVESHLMTSQAEHAEFAKSRLSTQEWFKNREVAYADLPQALSNQFKSAFDRHQYLEYLLDVRKALPESIEELRNKDYNIVFEPAMNAANSSKRAFATASQAGRVLMLQPLLNAKNGSLSDPKLVERLDQLILGDRATDPLVKSLYRAYLDSVPEGEKKILLSAVLSTLAEGNGKEGASVKAILESMGPFGVKAGQFLRTSGLANRKLSKELDDFLDRALAPVREQIFADLKKAFGSELKIVSSVGDLAGSGSVNYVVVADLKNPETGKIERVTVRFQRDAVEGMARNENEIWAKATAILKKQGDPQAAALARRLDEARLNAMETLKKGGVELDLSIERSNYEKARLAYSTQGVEVARPLDHFQKLVPQDLQSRVSIYEYIESTPLKKIANSEIQAKVHRRIMNAELNALKNGVFDPDGHDGNWLYHPETDRLVRIDYAQLREPSRLEHDAFKELMRSIILTGDGPSSARAIAKALPQTFEFGEAQPSLDLLTRHLTQILRNPKLPPQNTPHDRLFFIREELEKSLGSSGKGIEIRFRDSTRSALASLSRIVPHSQYLPTEEFTQGFVNAVDLTPTRAVVGMARAKMDAVRGSLTEKCEGFFSRLMRK